MPCHLHFNLHAVEKSRGGEAGLARLGTCRSGAIWRFFRCTRSQSLSALWERSLTSITKSLIQVGRGTITIIAKFFSGIHLSL
jgi:hypothetical protein